MKNLKVLFALFFFAPALTFANYDGVPFTATLTVINGSVTLKDTQGKDMTFTKGQSLPVQTIIERPSFSEPSRRYNYGRDFVFRIVTGHKNDWLGFPSPTFGQSFIFKLQAEHYNRVTSLFKVPYGTSGQTAGVIYKIDRKILSSKKGEGEAECKYSGVCTEYTAVHGAALGASLECEGKKLIEKEFRDAEETHLWQIFDEDSNYLEIRTPKYKTVLETPGEDLTRCVGKNSTFVPSDYLHKKH